MLVFILGVVLLLVAVLVLSLALRNEEQAGVAKSLALIEALSAAPEEMKGDLEKPFGERVLEPLRHRAVRVGRRLNGADSAERIRRKLDFAGNPRDWSVDRVVSVKVLAAVVFAMTALLLGLVLGAAITIVLVLALGGLALGFFAPDLYLYQATYDRSAKLERELPDAIDLLTISVEAGLGFDSALQQVARNTEGPLGEEFSRVLREMQIGQSRGEALRSLSARTDVANLKTFLGAMVQADTFGIPIAQVLRVQSREMRVKRRQRAETKAQQVPVKITVPLIFCILPALFVVILGPAAISILDKI